MNAAPKDPVSASEVEKDRLEIADLRAKLMWDRWLGHSLALVSCVILILGFATGLQQYQRTRTLEFERRFWEKQLEVYSRLVASAAQTANARGDSIDRHFDRLSEIYHGEFSLVADTAARESARRFFVNAAGYRRGKVDQADLLTLAKQTARDLQISLSNSSVSPLPTDQPDRDK
jgi:hypothetical protein